MSADCDWRKHFSRVAKGNVLNDQEEYEESIKAYDEAIRLNPKHATAWNNKGVVLEALGKTSESNAAYAKAKELGYTI